MAKGTSGGGGQRHVVPTGSNWAVKPAGRPASSTHRTQARAEQIAKENARRSGGGEVVIHGRDGRIRDSDEVGATTAPAPRRRAPPAVDGDEVMSRSLACIPDRSDFRGLTLCVAVAGGPRLQMLRPAELERAALGAAIAKEALFGPHAVLSTAQGAESRMRGEFLAVVQEEAGVLVDAEGTVSVLLPARPERDPHGGGSVGVVIEEELQERIERSLRLVGAVLDQIDPQYRLVSLAPVAALLGTGYTGWRTRAEEQASPDRWSTSLDVPSRVHATLPSSVVGRDEFVARASEIAEDLMVVLRRTWRR
ncbi:MAG TPA: DUF2188 domain-containing protein [Chloroflexota bacterium]